jgi:orotate phosphoribosyltransferase
MHSYQREFLQLAIEQQVLGFGSFELKSGRISPYFFNAGQFSDGRSMAVLGRCYAEAIIRSGLEFDMLFGPAYKGIPLVAAVCSALYGQHGVNLPFAYNRKETKDHGEGGNIVGAALAGRVLVVDDVISAGTSVRESMQWITAAGATVVGLGIALDRQERGSGALSAVQELEQDYAIPVISIANLDELINFLDQRDSPDIDLQAIRAYRDTYGV